jgi:hypothetical protein
MDTSASECSQMGRENYDGLRRYPRRSQASPSKSSDTGQGHLCPEDDFAAEAACINPPVVHRISSDHMYQMIGDPVHVRGVKDMLSNEKTIMKLTSLLLTLGLP